MPQSATPTALADPTAPRNSSHAGLRRLCPQARSLGARFLEFGTGGFARAKHEDDRSATE